MRPRNSVLPAATTSQEAVLRSRHPPSKRMPSSAGVISRASWTNSLTNSSRSGPLNRRSSTQAKVPPSRRDESSDQAHQLGVGAGTAHGCIFARRYPAAAVYPATPSSDCWFREACIRCSVLQPDPEQMPRPEEIHANLPDRRQEAKEQGRLGEVAAIEASASPPPSRSSPPCATSRPGTPPSTWARPISVASSSASTARSRCARHARRSASTPAEGALRALRDLESPGLDDEE